MSQTVPAKSVKRTPEQVADELRRLRAEMRADNPTLTDADWDELADRLGEELKARLAQRVRESRGESD
jgi:hypothetical protein